MSRNKKEFLNLQGPYLDQKVPSMTPELFAPEILIPNNCSGVHSSPSFSSDGTEMYWTIMPENEPFRILYMKKENNFWSKPREAPFVRKSECYNSFFLNDDNKVLFKSATTKQENVLTLWFSEREKGVWSKPIEFSPVFTGLGMGTSVSESGTIYFTLAKKGFGSHKIYKSIFKDGKYLEPEELPSEINIEGDNWQPFIAPDESYLVFGRYFPKELTQKLFISFRFADGSWTEAKSLDAINNTNKWSNAMWPYISPDREYFFFVSSEKKKPIKYQIYWVDKKLLDTFRE